MRDATTSTISAAILAGGRSSRMGVNKSFVRVHGRPLIERIIESVDSLGLALFIIAPPSDYAPLGRPVYPGLTPGQGPLGGVYTALSYSRTPYTLVVGCDFPFLNRDLLRFMLDLRAGYDVVAPLDPVGHLQGLQAVYSQACRAPIARDLAAGRLEPQDLALAERLAVQYNLP